MSMSLFIDPTDVLLFRDGRSFSASTEDNLAEGHFPPRPTAVYGALRSSLLSNDQEATFASSDFGVASKTTGTVVGTQTELGTLAIQEFTLARRTAHGIERLFPVPFDVLRRKEDADLSYSEARFTHLVPRSNAPGQTNMPGGLPLLWPKGGENDDSVVYTNAAGYLPERAFHQVMRGKLGAMEAAVKPEMLYATEPRTSVALNPETRTGRDGQLFTVSFTRPHDHVGFVVSLTGEKSTIGSSGWLRLGGEARSARYVTADVDRFLPDADDLVKTIKSNKGRFKLVLTTPAVFKGGWRPDGINGAMHGDAMRGTVAGCDVQLRGAAVGSYEHLGGWDLAAGRPKTTHRAVPAGSVYFFQLDDPEDAASLVEAVPTLALGADDALCKQGLGCVQIGTYSV